MIRVGITQRLIREKDYYEIRDALDIRWQQLLLSINIIPIPIPLDVDLRLYNELDLMGLILTGGNDLFSQSRNKLSKMRDNYENQCIYIQSKIDLITPFKIILLLNLSIYLFLF